MNYTECPEREFLGGLVGEDFKFVSQNATLVQWAEWLRAPLEHAAAVGNIDLFKALIRELGRTGVQRGRVAAAVQNAEVLSSLLGAGAQADVNAVSAHYCSCGPPIT